MTADGKRHLSHPIICSAPYYHTSDHGSATMCDGVRRLEEEIVHPQAPTLREHQLLADFLEAVE